ncbi:syndecan-2-B-like [Diretmus argenteus]
MRDLWLLFVLGLATGFISEKLLVSSQPSTPPIDDLYLEGRPSGDFPVDDEDGEDIGSGSGSGDYSFSDVMQKNVTVWNFNLNTTEATPTQDISPNQPTTTADSPPNPPTTAVDSWESRPTMEDTEMEVTEIGPIADWFTDSTSPSSTNPPPSTTTTTKYNVVLTEEVDNEVEVEAEDGRGSRMYEVDAPEEVTSENLWERTEVLAAVIACGVIGFLCAVFLLILLAYRMKKKDEGSYDLGETKLPPTAYQKAPTKEFYA